jgi:hypothetical protein
LGFTPVLIGDSPEHFALTVVALRVKFDKTQSEHNTSAGHPRLCREKDVDGRDKPGHD